MGSGDGPGERTEGNRGFRFSPGLAVAAIAAAGAAFRLYRLGEQSFWADDFLTTFYIGLPDFGSYIRMLDFISQDAPPAYFTLQYFWGQCAGGFGWTLRLLPVALGTAAIPFVYGMGARALNRKAGYLAAAFVALSPFQVFYAQSLHVYALLLLLAVVSIYSLMRLEDGAPWPWWAAHAAASLLLLLTHFLSVFLILAEALAMAGSLRRRTRRVLVWTALQASIGLPWVLWVLGKLRGGAAKTYSWFYQPSPVEFFFDLFADDAVFMSPQLSPSPPVHGFLPVAWAEAFRNASEEAAWVLLVLSMALLAYLLVRLFLSRGDDEKGECAPARFPTVLLACAALLPPLALAALTLLWRPCLAPRFTLYSAVCVHVLLACAVVRLRPRAVSFACAALLLSLSAYHLCLMLPAQTRTPWKVVGAHIAVEAEETDVVLLGPSPTPASILRWQMPRRDLPIVRVYNDYAACTKARALLGRGFVGDAAFPGRAVWLVYDIDYAREDRKPFEEALEEAGLEHRKWMFEGLGGLLVYRIQARAGEGHIHREDRRLCSALAGAPQTHNAFDVIARHIPGLSFGGEEARVLREVSGPVLGSMGPEGVPLLALRLAAAGEPELALRLFAGAAGYGPLPPEAELFRMGILYGMGRHDEARAIAETLPELRPPFETLLRPLITAADGRDCGGLRDCWALLEQSGMPLDVLDDIGVTEAFAQWCPPWENLAEAAEYHLERGAQMETRMEFAGAAEHYRASAAQLPFAAALAEWCERRAKANLIPSKGEESR